MSHGANVRGFEPEGHRRRSLQVMAGPYRWIKHPKGQAWVGLMVLTYRLRPEESFPLM